MVAHTLPKDVVWLSESTSRIVGCGDLQTRVELFMPFARITKFRRVS